MFLLQPFAARLATTTRRVVLILQRNIHTPTLTTGANVRYHDSSFSMSIHRHIFREDSTKKYRIAEINFWGPNMEFSPKAGLCKEIYAMRKKDPKGYELWLQEQKTLLSDYDGPDVPHDMFKKRLALITVEHLDGIEEAMNYKFKNYKNLMAILPRFPFGTKKSKESNIHFTIPLAVLGKSAVTIVGLDAKIRHTSKSFYLTG